MAEYLIQDTTLTEIANAIRNKADKTDKIPVSRFAKEINELKAGGNPPTLDDTLPCDASYVAGESVVCNVLILGDDGSSDYTYQWYVNNVAVVGANSSSYTFNGTTIGATTIYCNVTNQGGTTSSRVATITVKSTIPEFTYTGEYKILNDSDGEINSSNGNWKIKFLTSGTAKITALNGAADGVDIFIVGGGGGGAGAVDYGDDGVSGGWGGSGAYSQTIKDVLIDTSSYDIVIGGGGSGGGPYASAGKTGGTSTAFGYSANGGDGGGTSRTTYEFGGSSGLTYCSSGIRLNSSARGTANSGNGGSGANYTRGGAYGGTGGSGVVIIRNKR